MDVLNALAVSLLTRMFWTSIQAVGLIGMVYLLGRLLPQLSSAMRCTLWWLVGAQLLLGLLWHAPLELPWLPAPAAEASLQVAHPVAYVATAMAGHDAELYASPTTMATTPIFSWRTVVMLLWLAALLWQASRMLRQWRAARQVLRTSQPVSDGAMQALCLRKARQLGLRHCPQLRVSDAIISPQVIGLWQPTILLPAHDVLNADESSIALAHELVHLRRSDLWLGWIPALAQWLFCFHPLVHWAMREYALNRESACDAEVVQHDLATPQDYGRLLLRLGVAQPVHAGLAGASPSFHHLKRRLTMLQQTVNPPPSRARGWLLVAAIALLGVLPYRVTAAAADKVQPATASSVQTDLLPPPPPPPPPPPSVPPPPPAPPAISGLGLHHASISIHDNSADGFALLDDDSAIVNGSDTDLAAAKRLHQKGKPILWFRRGEQAWVIEDPAYVERARTAYAPLTELGEQQGKLGSKMGELGDRMGALGSKMAELGGQLAEMGALQAAFAQRRATLDQQRAELASRPVSTSNHAQYEAQLHLLDNKQIELERQRVSDLGTKKQSLRERQEKLRDQQAQLRNEQDALRDQQTSLREQGGSASRRATFAMGKVFDEAITKGVAKPTSLR